MSVRYSCAMCGKSLPLADDIAAEQNNDKAEELWMSGKALECHFVKGLVCRPCWNK